ncbi:MAG: sugar phosphate isomerase/epimerase [Dehalococcoidia bacterium]|nr:sugar phosphate isomerase/epimerase [Dehalococcoidia bacterium]
MNHEVSLSTMWARRSYIDLLEFSHDARDWGFTAIEANAYVTSPAMLDRLDRGPLPINSIHNPAPNIESSRGIRSYDLNLASRNESERTEAVAFARDTIAHAERLGAHAVVLHMGHVPIGKTAQRQLHDMWHADMMGTEEYAAVQRGIPKLRSLTEKQHLEQALRTILDLEGMARECGIMLGMETRHNLHEIPNIDEMALLLAETDPEVVGYWHDTGHAATQQRLGYTIHEEWLKRFADRLVGIHLHDLNTERDHQPPGTGEIDWQMIASYLPDNAIRVCEIGEWNDSDGVKGIPAFLRAAGVIAPLNTVNAVK